MFKIKIITIVAFHRKKTKKKKIFKYIEERERGLSTNTQRKTFNFKKLSTNRKQKKERKLLKTNVKQ